jgi:hypothetical protein
MAPNEIGLVDFYLIREAVDGLLLGVNPTELKRLDVATLQAEKV